MKIKIKKNGRGFKYGEFVDDNGYECSIQESSSAEKPLIWLGQNTGTHHLGDCLARMHIDIPTAKELIKHLTKFVETANL